MRKCLSRVGTELSKGLWDKKKKLVLGNSVDRAMLG